MQKNSFSQYSRLNYSALPVFLTLFENGDAVAEFQNEAAPAILLVQMREKTASKRVSYAVDDDIQTHYFSHYENAVRKFEELIEFWMKYVNNPNYAK